MWQASSWVSLRGTLALRYWLHSHDPHPLQKGHVSEYRSLSSTCTGTGFNMSIWGGHKCLLHHRDLHRSPMIHSLQWEVATFALNLRTGITLRCRHTSPESTSSNLRTHWAIFPTNLQGLSCCLSAYSSNIIDHNWICPGCCPERNFLNRRVPGTGTRCVRDENGGTWLFRKFFCFDFWGVVWPWAASAGGGSFAFPSSFLTVWMFSSWNLKSPIFQNVWNSFLFYILELWSVENKNRSKTKYVIHTGEGRARQRPWRISANGSCPVSQAFLMDVCTHLWFFLVSQRNHRNVPFTLYVLWTQVACVPLSCIPQPFLPLVSSCLEHCLLMYPCELKPQMTLMEKLPSLHLRMAVG